MLSPHKIRNYQHIFLGQIRELDFLVVHFKLGNVLFRKNVSNHNAMELLDFLFKIHYF